MVEVYAEKISAFARMLRLEGLPVSPKETEDACRILIALGLSDRAMVKTALRTVFAKSREEQLAFDRVFDGFFISEEQMRRQAAEQAQREREEQQQREAAERDLQQSGAPQLTEQERDTYATMPEAERQHLRDFMERYRDNVTRNPDLYANFIHSVFARTLLEQQMLMEDAALGSADIDPEMGLLFRDISQFKDTEIPRAITFIQRVARQINGEMSAKRQHGGHSGSLDFRRTIRKGLETGGTFQRLRYKHKPRRRKHLVLLCDVSGSMVQFSEFALRFIQSLNQVSESSRTFLFSEQLREADAFRLENMDTFRAYVKESGLYGRGTDLGTALEQLCAQMVLSKSTTLLILSDTKTIDQPRATAALIEAKRQAGRVLWLNPIPEGKWKYIRSVQTMAAICPMICCSTLNSLASACRRLAI